MSAEIERKLTTILCADVAGYSRLMESNEVRTLERLRRLRTLFAGLIERRRGRVVNTWGDGLIAEFPSVVEAVQAAIEAQKELLLADDGTGESERLRFRIGVNLGDVIVEGQDLYGEGVNVAARLQALAEPGGVVVSGTVYDHVRGKLAVGFDFAGPQQLHNIAEPVPAYRVTDGATPPTTRRPAPAAMLPAAAKGVRAGLGSRLLRTYILIVAFFFLINLFSGMHTVWFQWPALGIGFVMALRWSLSR
ncbi:MAG TPA: adenylate/guanylate cyclase domain-containing protein [Geminicoccus sp.]|uniref:adenylate/guanylate cyclase domain-containing protein n=1 Tax=Geminicoccus sp. TaxID=2024832 RepID=UPI002C98C691|nr:adenylate/guanylate cyclase domain-containing protein [Geminicoccus sp.]HWL71037.1 adenylate/guanylate cyclase domain-containing protein [Geminicoccus sp.]